MLGPDGKSIVVYEENDGASRVRAFSASLQQAIEGPLVDLHRAVLRALEDELAAAALAIPGLEPAEIGVNGAGAFAVGGPEGDNGLSGKKLVVDAYGPRVPIGGGALSGKDFYKADRAGAILARRVAKAVVMAGAARECTATLAIFPGEESFSIVALLDEGRHLLEPRRWLSLFDLSLGAAGDRYAPISTTIDLARYGHFTTPRLPWENVGFDARHQAPTLPA